MKKVKLLIIVIILLGGLVVAFINVPYGIEGYAFALEKANNYTVVMTNETFMGDITVTHKITKNRQSIQLATETVTMEVIVDTVGDKNYLYSKMDDTWYKTESPQSPDVLFEDYYEMYDEVLKAENYIGFKHFNKMIMADNIESDSSIFSDDYTGTLHYTYYDKCVITINRTVLETEYTTTYTFSDIMRTKIELPETFEESPTE